MSPAIKIIFLGCMLIALLLRTGVAAANSLQCGTWHHVPSPNPVPDPNTLYAGTALSMSNAWAVGVFQRPRTTLGSFVEPLIEHWDGTQWSLIPSPIFLASNAYLQDISAITANDVWAVGGELTYPFQTLIEHWDGSSWSVVPSPSPGTGDNYLSGVAAVTSTDVWAVGHYANQFSNNQTLMEHWDGTRWSVVQSPSHASVNNDLTAVAAVSSNDIWAAGYTTDGTKQTLIEHWDGTQWSLIPSPNPGQLLSYLYGLTTISSSDVWAVGSFFSSSGTNRGQTLIEHWNGTTWSVVSSPSPGGDNNVLQAVTSLSATHIWAVRRLVKTRESPIQTLIEHWDGATWSIVPSPNPEISN